MEERTEEFWRVQGPTGLGPYRSDWEGRWTLNEAHRFSALHPTPDEEWGLRFWNLPWTLRERLRFGFYDEGAAKLWFLGFWDRLAAAGYELVRVRGRAVLSGEEQVAFIPEGGGP